MKHLLRRLGSRWWYSHCSVHRRYEPACKTCQYGHWLSEWEVQKSKRWYRQHEFDPASGLFRRKNGASCKCGMCVTSRGTVIS